MKGGKMKFDVFGWRIFINAIRKKDLPKKDTCPRCGSHRFWYKKRINGSQKCKCLDCGLISYKW